MIILKIVKYKINDYCTTLYTTHVQLQKLFFKLTIGFVFLQMSHTHLMIDFKKKKKLLEFYNSCTKVVNVSYL